MPCDRCACLTATSVPIAVDGEIIPMELCAKCSTYYAAPLLPTHPVSEAILRAGLDKVDKTLHHRIPMSRLLLMARYMYDNQFDIIEFLCESMDKVSIYRLRESAKLNAAELKEEFPELKQPTVVYVSLATAMRELFEED